MLEDQFLAEKEIYLTCKHFSLIQKVEIVKSGIQWSKIYRIYMFNRLAQPLKSRYHYIKKTLKRKPYLYS